MRRGGRDSGEIGGAAWGQRLQPACVNWRDVSSCAGLWFLHAFDVLPERDVHLDARLSCTQAESKSDPSDSCSVERRFVSGYSDNKLRLRRVELD